MARIYQRGKVWYSDVLIGGERVRNPLDTDKKFAIEKLGKMIETGRSMKYKRPTDASSWPLFRERFIRHVSTKNRVTLAQYKRAIANLEAFQAIKSVSDITPGLVADLKTSWIEKKRGLYVRNRDIQSLKAMMMVAEAWTLVEKQDWSSVKRDKEPKGRLLWYTAKELKALYRACNGAWKTIAMLGSRAGLRRGEMFWLSWKDVDFERNRVHVSPKEEWNPKDHERRWVPMSEDLRSYLKGLPKMGDWVLDDEGGRPSIGSMTIYFRRLSKKAGLKGNIHTLRHTFGSHLASAGVSPFIIKEMMGHSKIEMTQRYLHLAPEAQYGAIKALPSIP